MIVIRPEIYAKKERKRELTRNEIKLVYELFLEDKVTPPKIADLLNVTITRIELVLFSRCKNGKYIKLPVTGIIFGSKQEAYWTEEEQMNLDKLSYSIDDLKDLELEWATKGTITVKSKL